MTLNLTFPRALAAVGQHSGGWEHHHNRLACLLDELAKIERSWLEIAGDAEEELLAAAEPEGIA